MAAIAWTDVTGVAPELSTVPVAGQNAILAVANTILNVLNWGGETSPKLFLARCYYAAHLGTLHMRVGVAGAVASEAAGGLSVGYQNPMLGLHTPLQLTAYGMAYLSLARSTAARAGMVINGGGSPQGGGWGG